MRLSSTSALLLVAACAAAWTSIGAAQGPGSAENLAARVQARYETVRDFTADFTLTSTSGLMAKSAVDRGRAMVKKPNRMRWIMETGSRSELVADGTMVYSYLPQDRTVYRRSLKDESSSALLLLSGQGDITRDFTPSLSGDQPAGEWHLTLTPPASRSEAFRTLTLVVDRTSLQLRGLTIVDEQGGTQRYRFSSIRENQGVPDTTFAFKMPSGVILR